jgi:heavy metal efflux system protein
MSRKRSKGASGAVISEVIDGQKRYSVALRTPDRYRSDPREMGNILLRSPSGEQVRLGDVAQVKVARGAEVVNRKERQRRIVVRSLSLRR